MRITFNLTFVLLLFIQTLTINGQNSSLLIDNSKASVFISYERQGRIAPLYKGDGRERIWLQLHNNTRIAIFLCKVEVPKEYGDSVLPRRVYQMGEMSKRELPQMGFETTDVCSVLELPPGKTTRFSVPSEELAFRRFIEVEFYYGWTNEWQHDMSSSLTLNLVRFGEDQIPRHKP